MLPALGSLATQQNNPTRKTMEHITKFLNYCASNPEATIRYHASGMILHVESDASYLSEPKARSRAAGFFYLSDQCPNITNPDAPSPKLNGAVLVNSKIMKEVVSSAAEAEFGTLFYNGKEACPLRTLLITLGHPQPPTPIATDNSTAVGIANDTMTQKRSKAIDMRFYWIRDRVRKGQFIVYWRRGETNRADYFSKHHPPAHHMEVRPTYLHSTNRFAPLAG